MSTRLFNIALALAFCGLPAACTAGVWWRWIYG